MTQTESNEPIARAAYEELADLYAAKIETKAHNAYYERPATLALLPEVKGSRVLDAGCGPGKYAEILLSRGAASILCLDASEKMLGHAKARNGDKVEFRLADFGQPMPFLESASFDLVLSPLALDYVKDWHGVFGEFFRALKPGGRFVFSLNHPFLDYMNEKSENYFHTERTGCTWYGFGKPVFVPTFRRPLSEVFSPLIDAGFQIEKVVEPLPTEDFRREAPQDYAKVLRRPCFICIRARKA